MVPPRPVPQGKRDPYRQHGEQERGHDQGGDGHGSPRRAGCRRGERHEGARHNGDLETGDRHRGNEPVRHHPPAPQGGGEGAQCACFAEPRNSENHRQSGQLAEKCGVHQQPFVTGEAAERCDTRAHAVSWGKRSTGTSTTSTSY
jgi:hypothetical protein